MRQLRHSALAGERTSPGFPLPLALRFGYTPVCAVVVVEGATV